MPAVGVTDEIHKMLIDKQVELTSKRRVPVSMTQVMTEIVKKGLPLVD